MKTLRQAGRRPRHSQQVRELRQLAGEMRFVVRKRRHKAKILALEAGAHGTAHQRELAMAAGRLPDASLYHGDALVTLADVAQHMAREIAGRGNVFEQLQRCAVIEVPYFSGLNDMPTTQLLLLEEVVDRRERRA